MDIPRIMFLLRNTADGQPLSYEGEFLPNFAYFDTGASGILISKETAEAIGLPINPIALFTDTGVAGDEYFDVSEPVFVEIAGYGEEDLTAYTPVGQFNLQVAQENIPDDMAILMSPIDLIGMPTMMGKIVVFHSSDTNFDIGDILGGFSTAPAPSQNDTIQPNSTMDIWDDIFGGGGGDEFNLGYFTAWIHEAGDPEIPTADFEIPIRFERFFNEGSIKNIAPEPIMAYNPVISDITISNTQGSSTGTWLFDTGAQLSIISSDQAYILGFIDEDGELTREPDFETAVGGVGGIVDIPGFIVDEVRIPTLQGYDLVYNNVQLAIHDIGVFDEKNNQYKFLDGVFGSNFLAATFDSTTLDVTMTPFDNIIFDTIEGKIGFDVNPEFPVPTTIEGVYGTSQNPYHYEDLNRDEVYDFKDLFIFTDHWLSECTIMNWNCAQTNKNDDNIVNFLDM